ncbi:MAG TPA: radical SAM protein [Verrucomicrobiae bacterium]|nr:radical SAM protein [Verrucomicrobiae bacterium]
MNETQLLPQRTESLLKRTTSRCPVCHTACPAEVWRVEGAGGGPAQVFLKRTCPSHGEASVCIASDARFYWLAKGNPENARGGACGGSACCASDGSAAGTLGRNAAGRGAGPFEQLATCLALIEIVNSCNLACPTCYADSPQGAGAEVDAVPLADLQRRIQGVIDRKGGIEILQLSGGEPTLHPQLFELLEWARAHPRIDYVLLNTNGVRLANEPGFAARLGELFAQGGLQVYLQFDGVQEAGQRWLRGADLRELRQRALDRCAAANVPVTLAMTVTMENLPHLWETIEFGLARPIVHGVTFQPMFGSGRVPSNQFSVISIQSSAERRKRESSDAHPLNTEHWKLNTSAFARLNTADILLAAVGQSGGRLRFDDFTPLPCGDPNCATIGYLIRHGGRTWPVSDFVDFRRVQGFLQNKVHYTVEDLVRCGCENEPLGELLKGLELKASMTFRLMVKPFMDAYTWDQDRIDRCCTHVIRPDGRLDSFCRYYSGFDCELSSPVWQPPWLA